MERKTFFCLFLCSLVIWTNGNGLLPLLPVYARQLGATPTETGIYLAFAYFCLAFGVMAAGRLLTRGCRAKGVLFWSGLLAIPVTLAVGWVDSIIPLLLLTSALWCLGGMGFSALNGMMANQIDASQRGRLFTLLAITSPLGSVVGGLVSGPIVDAWGYGILFAVMALFSLLWPLAAGLLEEPQTGASPPQKSGARSTMTFPVVLLLLASTAVYIANFIGVMGMSLMMSAQAHSASAISSTAAVGGLAAIPFIYIVGRLSDQFGRKRFWLLCVVSGLAGLLMLAEAQALYQYWLVAVLLRVLTAGNRGIGSAWMVDLTEVAARVKVIALLGATTWVGGMLGYLLTGYGLQYWGNTVTVAVAIAVLVAAIGLVIPLKYNVNRSTENEKP